MLIRRLVSFIAALLFATAAHATNLPVASFPNVSSVAGTDIFYDDQSATDKYATGTQIATFINSLFSGDCTVTSGGAVTCTKTNGTAFSGLATLAGAAAGDVAYFNGSSWTKLTGNASGTNCLQENSSGVPSWAACGGGGGSGTVNPGTAGQLGYYSGTGTTISGASSSTISCSAGSCNTIWPATVKTADYTVATTDAGSTLILNSASAHTFTGISATTLGANQTVCFANQGAGNLTLSGFGTVYGLVSNVLPGPGGQAGDASVCLQSDGTNYHAFQSQIPPDGTTITVVAGKLVASGGSATTVTVGSTTVSGTCTSGFNLYNNGGTLGCQANGGASGANPTATASDTAVNGVATTFMRSDAAPAVQKGSASQFGIVKVDGTTITATAGVISSVGGGGISCPTNFTAVNADCVWTISATSGSPSSGFVWHDLTLADYDIACYGLGSSASSATFSVEYSTGSGSSPTFTTSGYVYQGVSTFNGGSISGAGAGTNTATGILTQASGGTAFADSYIIGHLQGLTSTSGQKQAKFSAGYHIGTGYYQFETNGWDTTDTAGAILAVRFRDNGGGNIFGTCTLRTRGS